MGTLKPTFFSQQSVFNREIQSVIDRAPSIAIVNIHGFRDFHPRLAAANLKRHKLFSACDIQCAEIRLPGNVRGKNKSVRFRTHGIGPQLQDVHVTFQPLGVEQLPGIGVFRRGVAARAAAVSTWLP